MRKTTIVVASLLTAMAVSTVKAAETKADLVFPKGKKTAEFKVTLAEGKYKFVASENVEEFAIVKLAEEDTLAAGVDGVYALKAGEYAIRASLESEATAEVKATVWGYNTAVVAEAEEVVKKLTNDLSVAINQAGDKAYEQDDSLQTLSLKGSAISAKINAAAVVADATDEAWAKYVAYVDGKSYLNNGEATKAIKEHAGLVKDANANYLQYKAAIALYNKIKDEGNVLGDDNGVDNLQSVWNAAKKEIQDANPIEDLKNEVEAIKTDAEAAYEAGTCAGKFSASAIETIEGNLIGVKGSIPVKIAAIKSGVAAEGVYASVVENINTARTTIATKKSELYVFLINGTGDNQTYGEGVNVNGENNEIYEDTYAKQLIEIAKIERAINAVEAKNTKEAGKGYASAAAAQTEINAALDPLAGIISVCETNVLALRAAYNAKCADLQTNVVALYSAIDCANNPDTKAYYKTTLESLKSANDAIQAYLDECNAAHDKEYKDYESKKTAAIVNIKAVSDKISNAKNEEDKYNASKATIKTKQDALDAAKKNVAAAKYECKVKGHEYTYTIGNKFDATIKRIQDEIDAITAANNKSYTVNTNGAWDSKTNNAITTAKDFNIKDGSSTNLTLKYYTQTKSTLTVNADKNKKLDEAIGALSARATELVNQVGAIHEDIAANEAALKALKDKVGDNGDVTNDGNVKGENNKTYTEEINRLETALAAEKTALETALALDDDAKADKNHYEQVKALKTNASIAKDATTLLNSFDDNKTNWEQANLDAACVKLLAEAKRLIGEADKVVGTKYDAATYGKRANADWSEGVGKDKKDYKALNTTREGLQTILGADANSGVKKEVANASTRVTAHTATKEDLALLQKVVETLNTDVLGGFNSLKTLADRVKAEYTTEKNLNTKLLEAAQKADVAINGWKEEVEGEIYTIQKSVMEQATDEHDSQYKVALQKDVDKLNADLDEYYTFDHEDIVGKIHDSFVAETLHKDEPGKDGYTAKIAAIQTAADALIARAKAITANYNAWKSVNGYLTTDEVGKTEKTYDAIIAKAKADLTALYTVAGSSAEAQAYYNGLVTAEETEKTAIGTANETDYADLKENKDAALLLRVDESVARLQALAGAADRNEKAYKGSNYLSDKDGQLFLYNGAKEAWKKLSEKVAAKAAVDDSHYTDKDKEGWNVKLTTFLKTIESYNVSTKAAYEAGKANDDAFNKVITDVVKEMAAFDASFEGEYTLAVNADNLARKDRFDKAYTLLTDEYSKQIKAIANLSRLGDYVKEFEDDLNDVTTGNNIYKYAEIIRELNAKANKEYNATVASTENDFYDEKEENKTTAETYKAIVVELAQTYINDVNSKALSEYNGLITGVTGYHDAVTEYNVAISEKMAGWDKSVVADGVPTDEDLLAAKAILDKWEHAADIKDGAFVDLEFACKWVNEGKDEIASVINLVKSGLEASTVAQWFIDKANYNVLAQAESEAIAGFKKLADSKVETGYYSEEYAGILETVDAKIAEAEAKEIGICYDNYVAADGLKAALATLNITKRNLGTEKAPKYESHSATYWKAYDADQDFQNNDKYYNEHIAVIDGLRTKLDNAEQWADEMLSRHDASLIDANKGAIYLAERDYKDYRSQVDSDHLGGYSKQWNKDTDYGKGWQNTINNRIAAIYSKALESEKAEIAATVADLQYDYDKASAHIIAGDEKVDALLKSWKEGIAKITSDNANIYADYYEGKLNDKKVRDPKNKATADETKAAYLALEKTIGALKSEMKSYSDDTDKAQEAAYATDLEGKLADIKANIDGTKPEHKPVVKAYGETLEEVKAQYEVVAQLVADAKADHTILIDYNNINKDLTLLSSAAGGLKQAVDKADADWNYSDIISSGIADRFEAVNTYLNDIYEIAQYNEKKPSYYEGQYVIDDVEYDNKLDYDKAFITKMIESNLALYNEKAESEEMFVDKDATDNQNVISYINSVINTMWYNASVYNINETLYDVESLAYDVDNYLNNNRNKLTREDFGTFQQKLSEINDAKSKTAEFKSKIVKNAIITGETNKILGVSDIDIDGKPFIDEDEKRYCESFAWVNTNGVDEYSNVTAKAAQFTEDLNQLKADIKAALFLIGDVNNDLMVDINDYAKLAGIIINDEVETLTGKAFNIADANGDGAINVADLAEIVNFIRDNFEAHSKVRDFKSRELAANDQYTVGVNENVLSIGINNAVAYTGFQMDITLPMGASIVSDELTARAAGQEISINNIGGNTYRVLVMGVDGAAFKGNAGAIANLQLLNMHGTAAVSNAIFTDAYGTSYKLNMGEEATAINGVEAQQSASEMIYSVGGQIKNQVTKGINIIKSNGIVKKMLNK